MTILNQAELGASSASIYRDNVANPKPADVRQYNTDAIESSIEYGGAIEAAPQTGYAVTSTATKCTAFTSDSTDANALITPDQTNDKLVLTENGIYSVTIRLQGEWSSQENLRVEITANGAPNPLRPYSIGKEGRGANDPASLSVTNLTFPVSQSMIDAGSGSVDVELYLSSTSGPFSMDIESITLGVSYQPYTIRTMSF